MFHARLFSLGNILCIVFSLALFPSAIDAFSWPFGGGGGGGGGGWFGIFSGNSGGGDSAGTSDATPDPSAGNGKPSSSCANGTTAKSFSSELRSFFDRINPGVRAWGWTG